MMIILVLVMKWMGIMLFSMTLGGYGVKDW